MSTDDDAPEGYRPLPHPGPVLQDFGPLYVKERHEDTVLVGLRIGHRHLNSRRIAHGGVLVTLADSALGIALVYSRKPRLSLVTVSLTTDFVHPALEGDWVEAHVDIQRVGGRLAYANCYLHVGDRRILRASGVFALMPAVAPAPSTEPFDG